MNCDPIARWYRWLEYLGMGRALERRRFEFLPALAAWKEGREIPVEAALKRAGLPVEESVGGNRGRLGELSRPCQNEPGRGGDRPGSAARALVLGDGDGRFLEKLLAVRPAVHVDYVDSSAEMLALARERVEAQHGVEQAGKRVVFHSADARNWLPAQRVRYDFVFTHFFLDCLTGQEVEELVGRLLPFTTAAAVWIVSEFHQPGKGFSAWRAKVWIEGLYRVFGLTTGLRVRRLPDHRRVLAAHGFQMEREVQAEWGLLVSEWWQQQR